MKLPNELAESYKKERGCEPELVVRALYDLQGGLGATYLAADAAAATMYSIPAGGAATTKVLLWPEISEATVKTDALFPNLRFQTQQQAYDLRFCTWDRPTLDAVVRLWREHKDSNPASVSTEASATAESAAAIRKSSCDITPLVAFCASIHAIIACDHDISHSELNFLCNRIGEIGTIHQGRELFDKSGLDRVCECARTMLNEPQKRCLMANLITMALLDGAVHSSESDLLDRFQTELGLTPEECQTMFDVLVIKSRLSVFQRGVSAASNEWVNPLEAFCASMLAMMEADGEASVTEREMLQVTLPYPHEVQCAKAFLRARGLTHLLDRLGSILDWSQARCLMANLIGLAMADGVIHRPELALLDRFKKALSLVDADFDSTYNVLLTRDNLSVFAE